jgi:hypothetical protein
MNELKKENDVLISHLVDACRLLSLEQLTSLVGFDCEDDTLLGWYGDYLSEKIVEKVISGRDSKWESAEFLRNEFFRIGGSIYQEDESMTFKGENGCIPGGKITFYSNKIEKDKI